MSQEQNRRAWAFNVENDRRRPSPLRVDTAAAERLKKTPKWEGNTQKKTQGQGKGGGHGREMRREDDTP